jgi:hypothetical protein
MKHHFIDIMLNTKSDVPSMLACNVNRMLTQSYVNIEYPTKHRFWKKNAMLWSS